MTTIHRTTNENDLRYQSEEESQDLQQVIVTKTKITRTIDNRE
jgi:hypothetical protein